MAPPPANETRTALLVWWALLLPVYSVTFVLCILAHPEWDWLTVTVYLAGSFLFLFLFLIATWRRAPHPRQKEVKLWVSLVILDYFCLGCVMTVVTSPVLQKECPSLALLPAAGYFLVRAVRWKVVRGMRKVSEPEEP